ncbi:multicopper oxidase family protein [Streptomyces sp. NPDC088733]|uniref:multicopper oxidase family protein n=1 Tax=Streptomyces sp. NPDC088733 TaxID=3365880 RepID=UPI003813610C
MVTRRRVIQAVVAGGAFALIPDLGGSAPSPLQVPLIGRTVLDPKHIGKYKRQLVIPPVMPQSDPTAKEGVHHYTIAVRQFRQQVLPPGLPATTVWGYGSPHHPGTFHYPAFTIEARSGTPVRVRWENQLRDPAGRCLPHLLPVDPTLHWANPPGGTGRRDGHGMFDSTPAPYRGPVPIVTHLHGGRNTEESDGYPEAWYLPDAVDIPARYAHVGTFYDDFRHKAETAYGVVWTAGDAIFQYANEERAATFWFHDHALGVTRLNVYAGLAGFYLLRGGPADLPEGVLPGPAPRLGDPPGRKYHEIPLVIQDRSFHTDGSLLYPASRAAFDGFNGPYVPESDVPPIWNPEYFGNAMVSNGATWPVLDVEPRRYRFRTLNGCNARYLILKVVTDPVASRPVKPALVFWQLGSEGGFLPSPVEREQLLIAPAERADVIIDFTSVPVGTALYLINEGPDTAFKGGRAGVDFASADPATTGQVLRFDVRPLTSPDTSVPPEHLTLPSLEPLGPADRTRRLSLNEQSSAVLPHSGPRQLLLGTVDDRGKPLPMRWNDSTTENPALGATEVWEIHNFTADAHPIHVHEVQFQIVDRQKSGRAAVSPPEAWERGYKDTAIAYPGTVTRLKATFDRPGRFVWHCHMLEHEDNEMMRPYVVGPLRNGRPGHPPAGGKDRV